MAGDARAARPRPPRPPEAAQRRGRHGRRRASSRRAAGPHAARRSLAVRAQHTQPARSGLRERSGLCTRNRVRRACEEAFRREAEDWTQSNAEEPNPHSGPSSRAARRAAPLARALLGGSASLFRGDITAALPRGFAATTATAACRSHPPASTTGAAAPRPMAAARPARLPRGATSTATRSARRLRAVVHMSHPDASRPF